LSGVLETCRKEFGESVWEEGVGRKVWAGTPIPVGKGGVSPVPLRGNRGGEAYEKTGM